MIKSERLDFWIKHRRNVLFIGNHGVGKTSMTVEAFERAKLMWKYFSAATMDPWVDFIGVPRAIEIAGGQQILEMVRPKEFADDMVQAIFFDEFNRSHKKVRNAVMELLQFKSINGRKFNNLQMIWAAVNPDDEDRYDVERMDKAQMDRFQIQVEIPYKCDHEWFSKKFGEKTATAAISWWEDLPGPEKDNVSPRRLEYALAEASIGGDMRDVLPKSCNISKLITSLQVGPIDQVIKSLMKENNHDHIRDFLSQENNYSAAIGYILKSDDRMKYFLPLIAPEKLAALLPKQKKVLDIVISLSGTTPVFAQVINDVYNVAKNNARKDRGLRTRIEQLCESMPQEQLPETLRHLSNATTGVVKPIHGKHWQRLGSSSWQHHIDLLRKNNMGSTHGRRHSYREIERYLPPTMTEKEAKETLELLNEIARRSNIDTLKRSPSFIPLANHCCQQLEEKTKMKLTDMVTKFHREIHYIRRKLHSLDKSKQFYLPI